MGLKETRDETLGSAALQEALDAIQKAAKAASDAVEATEKKAAEEAAAKKAEEEAAGGKAAQDAASVVEVGKSYAAGGQTYKLTAASVKGAFKGSKVSKVKVPKAKLKAYKKAFTKKNTGTKAKKLKVTK